VKQPAIEGDASRVWSTGERAETAKQVQRVVKELGPTRVADITKHRLPKGRVMQRDFCDRVYFERFLPLKALQHDCSPYGILRDTRSIDMSLNSNQLLRICRYVEFEGHGYDMLQDRADS